MLPTSPINNFDGCQFQITNAKSEPTKAKTDKSVLKATTRKMTIKHEDSSPSNPSTKFEKFITEGYRKLVVDNLKKQKLSCCQN